MIKYSIRNKLADDGITELLDDNGNTIPMTNDRGQVQVEIDVDGKKVNQDFDIATLDEDVKKAIVILRRELSNAPTIPTIESSAPVTVLIRDLPDVPEEDFQEEQPEE